MEKNASSIWKQSTQMGLIAGVIVVMISLVGMVESFGDVFVINRLLTLGDVLYLAPILMLSYIGIRRVAQVKSWLVRLALSAIIGVISGVTLSALVIFGSAFDIRPMFINASPNLFSILMNGRELPVGALIPVMKGLVASLLAVLIFYLPQRTRSAVVQGIMWTVLIGTLKDQIMLAKFAQVEPFNTILRRWLFAQSGFSLVGALVFFLIVVGISYWVSRSKPVLPVGQVPVRNNRSRVIQIVIVTIILLLLPPVLGIFFSEVLDTSGLFILMSLGLNIVVGFAGLLDLGYVGFYAIGAYTMAVFTSPEMGFFNLTFWQAMPIALVMSVAAGILLGLPVLRMRGDYLAIVTLGFGEIIRLLALSDWLKPYLGGTQGIQRIAQPKIGPIVFDSLQEIYYLILICIAIVAFISWRLKDSNVGRSWMAIREDEDVAQAMGINHVGAKLLAFATGALFAGLSGTLLGAKLTSVYPHSFNFIVSINVLSIIIIGGMGSIPGVFIGGLVLMGLPGILTEFAEYRWLFYGAALVLMMLTKPEGLWPESRRMLELHEAEETDFDESLASAVQPGD